MEHNDQVFSFLQYTNKIYVSRAIEKTETKNAMFELSAVGTANPDLDPAVDVDNWNLINNLEHYDFISDSIVSHTDTAIKFISKDPGLYGNDVEIAIANKADFVSGTV